MIPLHGFLQDLASPDAIAEGKILGKDNRLLWSHKKGSVSFSSDGTSSEFHNSIRKLMGYDVEGRTAAPHDPNFRGDEFEPDLPAFNQLKRLVSEQQDLPSVPPDEIATFFVRTQSGKETSSKQEISTKQNDVFSSKQLRLNVVEKVREDAIDDTSVGKNPSEFTGMSEETMRNVSHEMLQPLVNEPDTDEYTTVGTPFSKPVAVVSRENARIKGSVLSDPTQSDDPLGKGPRLDAGIEFGGQLPIGRPTKPIPSTNMDTSTGPKTQKIQDSSTRGMTAGDAKNVNRSSNPVEMEKDAVLESQSKITSTEKESGLSRNSSIADPATHQKMASFRQETSGLSTISSSTTSEKVSDTEIPSAKAGNIPKSPDQGPRLSHKAAGVVSESPLKGLASETGSGSENDTRVENRSSHVATEFSSTRGTSQVSESPMKGLASETGSGSENDTRVENRSSQVATESLSTRRTSQVSKSPLEDLVSKVASDSGKSARVENRSPQVATESSFTRATSQVSESPVKGMVLETASGSENSAGVESRSLRPATDPVAENTSKVMAPEAASSGKNRAAVAPSLSQGDLSSRPATSQEFFKVQSDFQTVEEKVTVDAEKTIPSPPSWRTKAAADTSKSFLNQVVESDDGLDISTPIGKGEKTNKTEETQKKEIAALTQEREKVTVSSKAGLLNESKDVTSQTPRNGREHQFDEKTQFLRTAPNHADSRDGKADPHSAGDAKSTSNNTENAPRVGMRTAESFTFQPIELKHGEKGTGEMTLSQNQAATAPESTKTVVDPATVLRRIDGEQSFRPIAKTASASASKAKSEKEGIDIVMDRQVEETDAKGLQQPKVTQTHKTIRNPEFSANRVASQEEHFADRMKSATPASTPGENVVREANQQHTEHLAENMRSNGPDPGPIQTSHDETTKPASATTNMSATSTGQTTASNPKQSMPTSPFQSSVMEQVVRHSVVRSLKGRSEVQIQLKPEFLGNVRMNIATEKNQVLVRIVTDSIAVKETIDNHVHQLRAELQNQGLTIDKFEVAVHSEADHHPGRDQSSQMQKHNASQNGRQANDEQNKDSERRDRGNHAHDEHQRRNPNHRNGINHFA